MTRSSRTSRAAAATTGVGVVAGALGGLVLPARAGADPAPGQDVDNDWGQSAADVQAEITAVVDADPRVVAARSRYAHALVAYAEAKERERAAAAAYAAARSTPSALDDPVAQRALAAVRALVYRAACEVVASQLAMVDTVTAVTGQVRSHHYVKAPYVALPATPTGLRATGQDTQVSLSWDEVAGASSYLVLRDGRFVATTLLPAFLDTGLENGVAHDYAVVAKNVAGWSPASGTVTAAPSPAAPEAPTGLSALPGDGAVDLSWTAVPTATGYRVYRDGALVATPVDAALRDLGLVNGTPYSYAVEAVNGAVPSPASAAVVATPVALAPAAPTGLAAVAGDAQAALTWTPSAGATSYAVLRDGQQVATTTVPSYVDTGLVNGQSYDYAVTAARDNSPASAPSSTLSVRPVVPPLPTPTGLAGTPGDARVDLTWSAVPGATSYRVTRNGALLATVALPTYTDTGVANGTSYTYDVTAVSATSSSAASAPVTVVPVAPLPGAPSGVTALAGDTVATLSWNPVAGATGYRVYRDGALRTTVTTPGFTDTGLTNGTPYGYQVAALVAGVESARTAPVTVTPFVVAPATPSGLVATPGDRQVVLSWAPATNAQSYLVYRGGALVGSPTGTTFTDTGLTDGTTYSWTVRAVNGSATSAASAPVSATPMARAPAAPTGLAGTPGDRTVALSWTASPSATSYRVYRNGVLVASPTTPAYDDSGLTNGTSYTYYVVAVAATTPSAPSSSIAVTPAKPPVNGTFTGATAAIASGHGTLRVVIVVSSSRITSATGTLLTNDGSETVQINNNAIPQYNTKAVAANSANISVVSGATLTWAAYKSSLQSALTQAGM